MEFLTKYFLVTGAAGLCLLSCGPPKPINLEDFADYCTIISRHSPSAGLSETDTVRHIIPQLLWKRDLRYSIFLDPSINLGFLFIPVPDNKLYLISAKDGSDYAEIKFRGPIMAPVIVADSLAILNIGGKKLLVENWVTQKTIWEAELEGDFTKPSIVDGMLFWLDAMNYMRCFDVVEGKRIWDMKLSRPAYTVLEADSLGAVVFADDGLIECYDPKTGVRLWSFDAGTRIKSAPAVSGDRLILATVDGTVACLNMKNGELEWMREMRSAVLGSLAADAIGVYLGTNDRFLKKLDLLTGEVVWEIKTDGPIKAGPGLTDDLAIFASLDHKVYFVDKLTGKTVLAYETGGMLTTKPVVCGNRVFIAGEDEFLYCFGLQETK